MKKLAIVLIAGLLTSCYGQEVVRRESYWIEQDGEKCKVNILETTEFLDSMVTRREAGTTHYNEVVYSSRKPSKEKLRAMNYKTRRASLL
jgi:hypothetical protein